MFDCKSLEYIFVDNYSEASSRYFDKLVNAKRIGLIKSRITEFEAIKNMPQLEHIGIGYNPKIESIEWIEGNDSLISVAFQNCKNIKDWEKIGSLKKIEKLTIENCGEISSLDFLKQLDNIKEVRIIGATSIRDGKIKEIMDKPQLNYLIIPIKKGYDITLQDLDTFNGRE